MGCNEILYRHSYPQGMDPNDPLTFLLAKSMKLTFVVQDSRIVMNLATDIQGP